MTAPANDDRRKSNRQTSNGYLQVEGQLASLIDWSFGGIGIRFDGPVELEVSAEVDIRILDTVADRWEDIKGIVRWIDQDGKVGIEFTETDQRLVGILLRLLGKRLSELPH